MPFTFLLFTFLIATFSTPVLSAVEGFADGSILGWGEQVVGVDLSGGFVNVAAGSMHSLGLKNDGSIVAWGWNDDGQCNIPSPNTGFIAIAAGWAHSLAIKKVCQYKLIGDLNDDCRVDFRDFAIMASNWLIDCNIDPNNSACIPK